MYYLPFEFRLYSWKKNKKTKIGRRHTQERRWAESNLIAIAGAAHRRKSTARSSLGFKSGRPPNSDHHFTTRRQGGLAMRWWEKQKGFGMQAAENNEDEKGAWQRLAFRPAACLPILLLAWSLMGYCYWAASLPPGSNKKFTGVNTGQESLGASAAAKPWGVGRPNGYT